MLPDIGASELMVIALVALIFVGPKDLPVMLKKIGQFTAKMRRMAADFRTSFDDMARQSELEDLRREVEQMRASATQAVSDPIGIDSTLRETINDIDAGMTGGGEYDYDHGVIGAEPRDLQPATPAVEDQPLSSEAPKPARKKPAARKPSAAKTKSVEASSAAVAAAPAKPRRRAATKAAS